MLADPPETQGAERGLASAHRVHPIFAQRAVSWCRRRAQFQRSEPRVNRRAGESSILSNSRSMLSLASPRCRLSICGGVARPAPGNDARSSHRASLACTRRKREPHRLRRVVIPSVSTSASMMPPRLKKENAGGDYAPPAHRRETPPAAHRLARNRKRWTV